jgi:hypothetical protein
MENIGVTVLPSMVILKIGQLNIRGSTYLQIEGASSSEKKNFWAQTGGGGETRSWGRSFRT